MAWLDYLTIGLLASQPNHFFWSSIVEQFDVIVIGGGQGGLPAAHMSANLGGRVALIEMREVGGT